MNYRCLNTQIFEVGQYKIVPLRDEDKYIIMQWRNEQIYHLRQNEPLTTQKQEWYFENIVNKLFEEEKPSQILFSYLESNVCIGYGGLVHINWIDKHAEISFIINTKLEKDEFEFHWITYLSMIEQVAFQELNFHKIFTFAFDLRPRLFQVIERAGFIKEACFKEHYLWEGTFIDAIVHSKFNNYIKLRMATIEDLEQYFEWVNDENVRLNAVDTGSILLDQHTNWFHNKINANDSLLYFFHKNESPLGQVRFDFHENIIIVDYSLNSIFRGKGLGLKMLEQAIFALRSSEISWKKAPLFATVKFDNIASYKIFEKLGFSRLEDITINKVKFYQYRL